VGLRLRHMTLGDRSWRGPKEPFTLRRLPVCATLRRVHSCTVQSQPCGRSDKLVERRGAMAGRGAGLPRAWWWWASGVRRDPLRKQDLAVIGRGGGSDILGRIGQDSWPVGARCLPPPKSLRTLWVGAGPDDKHLFLKIRDGDSGREILVAVGCSAVVDCGPFGRGTVVPASISGWTRRTCPPCKAKSGFFSATIFHLRIRSTTGCPPVPAGPHPGNMSSNSTRSYLPWSFWFSARALQRHETYARLLSIAIKCSPGDAVRCVFTP